MWADREAQSPDGATAVAPLRGDGNFAQAAAVSEKWREGVYFWLYFENRTNRPEIG